MPVTDLSMRLRKRACAVAVERPGPVGTPGRSIWIELRDSRGDPFSNFANIFLPSGVPLVHAEIIAAAFNAALAEAPPEEN